MNKKFLLTVCLAIIGILGMKAQYGIVALHHNGNVTLYNGTKIQEAMDASVKGDTLYLSEGLFEGVDVTHGIVVLGSGQKTIFANNISITGNEENKDLGGYEFYGLNIAKEFRVATPTNGLKLIQCYIEGFWIDNSSEIDNALIAKCYVNWISLWPSIKQMDIVSSKIKTSYNHGASKGAVTFNYCNVDNGNNTSTGADDNGVSVDGVYNNTYINSIVYRGGGATYMNCVYDYEYNSSATHINSWHYGGGFLDENLVFRMSDEEMESRGYISTDGTVVGINGGNDPYTLELSAPHVIDHTLDVDNVNKTLKVTLKMNE